MPVMGMKRTRYAPGLARREREALTALEQWMGTFDGHTPWVSISGGKDSLVALDLARRVNPEVKAAFFDSGLEFPQTRKYIRGLTRAWNLHTRIYPAEPSALDVLEANHSWDRSQVFNPDAPDMHEALITRPLQRALDDLGPACVYGVRADESEHRRMYLSAARGQLVRHDDAGGLRSAHISPAWQWSSEEVFAYITAYDLPLNPLYRKQVELGVPEHRARVGLVIDGWGLEQGRWAVAHALAPSQCRKVEAVLPALAEMR